MNKKILMPLRFQEYYKALTFKLVTVVVAASNNGEKSLAYFTDCNSACNNPTKNALLGPVCGQSVGCPTGPIQVVWGPHMSSFHIVLVPVPHRGHTVGILGRP